MALVKEFSEPEWILDRNGLGELHWRRHSNEKNSRVKFRYDVEVKEFQRGDYELEDAEWLQQTIIHDTTNHLQVGFTSFLYIVVTIALPLIPWYILIGPTINIY